MGTTALEMLHTPQPVPPEIVLAMLTNELVERGEGDVALVLDDYHVITAESIQRTMTILLEHLHLQLHLILATRADPPLLLARLRAQGQLAEIRTADLRFGVADKRHVYNLCGKLGVQSRAQAIARARDLKLL